ncbi:hypothetical protein BK005_01290 [bacterium CG10_37_50]|nr:MAG: hypothetical protein BK005_01290 [bacterium CG10_37_50]
MPKLFSQLIILSLSALLLVPINTLAYQEVTNGGDLVATVSPNNPGPNTLVKISLRAYGVDIDNSLISWGLNGKLANSGFGLKNFSFQTGSLGSRTIVSIDVLPRSQSGTIKKLLVFEPLDIELNWQANTSRPYWYQGRALISPESTVIVSALVTAIDQTGKTIPPETLIYKWNKNDKILNLESGVGRSNLTYTATKKGADKIDLTIITPSGNTEHRSVLIPVENPQIALYLEQPLLGTIFQQQLKAEQVINDSLAVRAEAFGFSNDLLDFNWTLGQEKIFPKLNDLGLMYFAIKSSNPINQRVDLLIKNPAKIFQSAQTNFFLNNTKNQTTF